MQNSTPALGKWEKTLSWSFSCCVASRCLESVKSDGGRGRLQSQLPWTRLAITRTVWRARWKGSTSFGRWILQRPLTRRRLFPGFVNFLAASTLATPTIPCTSIKRLVYAWLSSVSSIPRCTGSRLPERVAAPSYLSPSSRGAVHKNNLSLSDGVALSRHHVERRHTIIYEIRNTCYLEPSRQHRLYTLLYVTYP